MGQLQSKAQNVKPAGISLATVITGASGGIGEALARQLAATEKQTLVLVARSADKLDALARELVKKHGVRVDIISLDLQAPGSAAKLMAEISARGLEVDTLINNAGFGVNALFADTDPEKIAGMLQLNMISPTELCHAVLPGMRRRRRGRIMNVASVGAFMACPRFAAYGATKAYVLSLTEALAAEEKNNGIRVTVVCPGATNTGFHGVAGNEGTLAIKIMDTPETVAKSALRALASGKVLIVTGWMNKMVPWFVRLMPRKLFIWMGGLVVSH